MHVAMSHMYVVRKHCRHCNPTYAGKKVSQDLFEHHCIFVHHCIRLQYMYKVTGAISCIHSNASSYDRLPRELAFENESISIIIHIEPSESGPN